MTTLTPHVELSAERVLIPIAHPPEPTLVHLRSYLFMGAFAVWSTLIILGALPFAIAPARTSGWWFRNWNRGTIFLLRLICGVRVEVRGREFLPRGGGLIAAKHQCMFDAFTPYPQLPQPCVVTKQELAKLPFLGWFAAQGDRDRALRQLFWAAATADSTGALPEQVGEHLLAPAMTQEWVDRWGPVAQPLLWSHAMFIRLAVEMGVLEVLPA